MSAVFVLSLSFALSAGVHSTNMSEPRPDVTFLSTGAPSPNQAHKSSCKPADFGSSCHEPPLQQYRTTSRFLSANNPYEAHQMTTRSPGNKEICAPSPIPYTRQGFPSYDTLFSTLPYTQFVIVAVFAAPHD